MGFDAFLCVSQVGITIVNLFASATDSMLDIVANRLRHITAEDDFAGQIPSELTIDSLG